MKLRINTQNILIKIMCLMGVTTLLTSLPFISFINRFLMGIFILILIRNLLKKSSFNTVCILMITLIVYTYDIFKTAWPIQNINEVIYFGMWILLFQDISNHYVMYVSAIKNSVKFIEKLLIICNCIIAISFVVPSCYSQSYFFSFAGSQHRFSSSAMMLIALSALLMRVYGKKKYIFYAIIPAFGALISGARTYMIIVGVIGVCLYYIITEHKFSFYFSIVPLVVISVVLIMNSNIMAERAAEIARLSQYYGDPLRAITSGRSAWLLIDLKHFWQSSWLDQLLGCGFHFIRYVNTVFYGQNIWAHNDYVMLLGTNGYIGLILYLVSYVNGCNRISGYCTHNKKKLLLVAFHIIYFINAMLNMVYTYSATTLATVFLLIAFMDNTNFSEINILRKRKDC